MDFKGRPPLADRNSHKHRAKDASRLLRMQFPSAPLSITGARQNSSAQEVNTCAGAFEIQWRGLNGPGELRDGILTEDYSDQRRWKRHMPLLRILADHAARAAINMALLAELFAWPPPIVRGAKEAHSLFPVANQAKRWQGSRVPKLPRLGSHDLRSANQGVSWCFEAQYSHRRRPIDLCLKLVSSDFPTLASPLSSMPMAVLCLKTPGYSLIC